MESVVNIKLSDELKVRYDKLFQDGFLVNLHIAVWGMGSRLNKDDLGIEEAVPDIYTLGKKMLILPKRFQQFKSVESKARRYLYQNSYPFHISEAHFIPKKKLLTVLEKLDDYKKEFLMLVDDFVKNYEEYKKEAIEKYPELADTVYPNINVIKQKFKYGVVTYELAMPRQLEQVDIQKLIDRSEAKEEAKKRIEKQLEEQYATAVHQIDEFTDSAARALRSQIGDVCNTLVEKIKNKEIISKTNINMIREEIVNFRALNFLDDKVVTAEIDKLDKLVSGSHDFKKDQETIDELNTALQSVLKTASETSDISALRGTYFRAIKV